MKEPAQQPPQAVLNALQAAEKQLEQNLRDRAALELGAADGVDDAQLDDPAGIEAMAHLPVPALHATVGDDNDNNNNDEDNDDDDGMETEEMLLGATEEHLREELDMASDVGELLLSPLRTKRVDDGVDHDPLRSDADHLDAEDGSSMVSAIFCLLGVGTLLPWNAFISSEPYFHARLCSLFGDGGGIELWFGLCFNACGFLTLIAVIATAMKRQQVQAETGAQTTSTANYGQVLWALSIYLLLFLITTGAVLVETVDPTFFLVATLVSLSVFGSCLAVAGTNIVGIASIFPPRVAIAPFFAGQATGGAFISFTNFISATAEDPKTFWDEHCRSNLTACNSVFDAEPSSDSDDGCPLYHRDMPTFWYFFLGSVILMLCIVGFVVLDRLAVTKYYRRLASGEQLIPPDTYNAEAAEASVSNKFEENVEETILQTNDLTQPLLQDESSAEVDNGDLISGDLPFRSILESIQFPALAILMTSFVTLSLFPAFTSTMQSVAMCEATNRLQNDLFEPLGFILFNFPDLLARILAPLFIDIRSVQRRPQILFVAAAARLIFSVLFLFAKSSSTDLPYVNSDLYSISIAICFAFSNGILMSLCFMVAPQVLPGDSTEMTRQRGSDFMNFALACGLLGGSISSYIFHRLASAL